MEESRHRATSKGLRRELSVVLARRASSPSTTVARCDTPSTWKAPACCAGEAPASSMTLKLILPSSSLRMACMAVWATMGSASPSKGASAVACATLPSLVSETIASRRVRASADFNAARIGSGEMSPSWSSRSVSARKAQAAIVGSPASLAMDAWEAWPRICFSANKAAIREGRGLAMSAASGSRESAEPWAMRLRWAARRVRWLGLSSSLRRTAGLAVRRSGRGFGWESVETSRTR